MFRRNSPTFRLSAVIVAVAGCAGAVQGQNPELAASVRVLGFQGLLTDGAGVRLVGNHELDFRIYDVPAGGAPIYSDLNRIVAFANGLCNTTVGTAGNPIPPAVFDTTAKYLGITVDNAVTELSPRILLSAGSYSFRADNVQNEELTDDIDAGSVAANGTFDLFRAGIASPVLSLNPLVGGGGRLAIFDGTAVNNLTVVAQGGYGGSANAGRLQLFDGAAERIVLEANDTTGGLLGSELRMFDTGGVPTIQLDSQNAPGSGGAINLRRPAALGISLLAGDSDGAALATFDGIVIDGADAVIGPNVRVPNPAGLVTANLHGGLTAGVLTLSHGQPGNEITMSLEGGYAVGTLASRLIMRDGAVQRVLIEAHDTSGTEGASFQLRNEAGQLTFEIDSDLDAVPGASGGFFTLNGYDFGSDDGISAIAQDTDGAAFMNVGRVRFDAFDLVTGPTIEVPTGSAGTGSLLLSGGLAGTGCAIRMDNAAGRETLTLLGGGPIVGGTQTFRNGSVSPIATITLTGGSDGGGSSIVMSNGLATPINTIELFADSGNAGILQMRNADGLVSVLLDADSGGGSLLTLRNSAGITRVSLDGDGTDLGGLVTVSSADGNSTVVLDGEASGNGTVSVRNDVGAESVLLTGDNGRQSGRIQLNDRDGGNIVGILLDGVDSAGTGGEILVADNDGTNTIEINGDNSSGGSATGELTIRETDGSTALLFLSDLLTLRNAAGSTTISWNRITGAKSAVVETRDHGQRYLYCMESPEVVFEDFGGGQLKNGRAVIKLDPIFLQTVTVNQQYPLRVFVTPTAECNGVFVRKGDDQFEVVELNSGKSSATFDYRIVAKRRGLESNRLDPYVEQGNADQIFGLAHPSDARSESVDQPDPTLDAVEDAAPPPAPPAPRRDHSATTPRPGSDLPKAGS